MRAKRLELPAKTAAEFAVAAARRMIKHSAYQKANKVAAYIAVRGEITPDAIVHDAWQSGKSIYIPVLTEDKHLLFTEYTHETPLRPNRFGIPEPVSTTDPIEVKNLDLVITPLLAFDRDCNRIGMGAGYYDRTFAVHNAKQMTKAGLAYEFQKTAKIDAQPWDIRMDFICTEQKIYEYSESE